MLTHLLIRSSRWNALFIVIYVLLGVYFLTNLILAVIYDSFKEQVESFLASEFSRSLVFLSSEFFCVLAMPKCKLNAYLELFW
jgi:hypothetical protein